MRSYVAPLFRALLPTELYGVMARLYRSPVRYKAGEARAVLRELLDPARHPAADAAEYLRLPVREVVRQGRQKDNPVLTVDIWNRRRRESESEYREFYLESPVYVYRQDWYHRHETWYDVLRLCRPGTRFLDYGCGTGAVSKWLLQRCPGLRVTLADIPAATNDYVRWRMRKHGWDVEWITLGTSRDPVPLSAGAYEIVYCCDVLEHTFSPLEIVQAFHSALSDGGHLVWDFIDDPTHHLANTKEAQQQRQRTIAWIEEHFRHTGGKCWKKV